MRTALEWVLFGFLVFYAWVFCDQFDEYYKNITYPAIEDPTNAPNPVPVFHGAAPVLNEFGVDETATGCTYYWTLNSPWPIETVGAYYSAPIEDVGPDHRQMRPWAVDASRLGGDRYWFRWAPPKAIDGEFIEVTLKPGHLVGNHMVADGTTIVAREVRVEKDKLPPALRRILEFVGLEMFVVGLFTLYKDRVFAFFAAVWRWYLLHSPSELYSRVGSGLLGLWYDPVRQNHWDGCEKTLETVGFSKVCDCIHKMPRPRQYGRVMQRHGQVYCLAMFSHLGRKRLVWLEFFSLFADGSAVYTTTHRDPEFKRPKEYPLFQVPESADTKQVLNVHLQNVEGHGGQLAMVGPDKILEVLSQLERTVMIHKPAPPPKATLASSSKVAPPPPDGAVGGATSIAMISQQQLPVGPHVPLPVGPHAPKQLKAPPPLAAPPAQPADQTIAPEPSVNEVTAAMAKYAVNREASVLGIAAVAATEKAEEHEALKAEQGAKEDFKNDVVARIRELIPDDLEIKERDALSLVIVRDRTENELDLETPYYMCKSNPDSRAKIINGVAQRVKQGAF